MTIELMIVTKWDQNRLSKLQSKYKQIKNLKSCPGSNMVAKKEQYP